MITDLRELQHSNTLFAAVRQLNNTHGRGTLEGFDHRPDGNKTALVRLQFGWEYLKVTMLPNNRFRFRGRVRSIYP